MTMDGQEPTGSAAPAFFEELTASQAQSLLLRGTPAILPVGSLEAHGQHLPLGTDGLIALAFAVQLAGKTSALVLPPIPYGHAPTTANLPATLSLPSRSFLDLLEGICRGLVQKGCHRIVLLNIHKENSPALSTVVHGLFTELGACAFYVNPYNCFAEELDANFWKGQDNAFKEASLFLGACSILSKGALMGPVLTADSRPVTRPAERERLRRAGVVGFQYHTEEDHIAPRGGASTELGLRYIDLVTDRLVPIMSDYLAYTSKEGQG